LTYFIIFALKQKKFFCSIRFGSLPKGLNNRINFNYVIKMTSKLHEKEIEKIKAIFTELGYYVIRIDKRSSPDLIVSRDPSIIAIEVEIKKLTQKEKSLREKMDFQRALIIQPPPISYRMRRRQAYQRAIELKNQTIDQTQIKQIILEELRIVIPKSTLSEWLSGKHEP